MQDIMCSAPRHAESVAVVFGRLYQTTFVVAPNNIFWCTTTLDHLQMNGVPQLLAIAHFTAVLHVVTTMACRDRCGRYKLTLPSCGTGGAAPKEALWLEQSCVDMHVPYGTPALIINSPAVVSSGLLCLRNGLINDHPPITSSLPHASNNLVVCVTAQQAVHNCNLQVEPAKMLPDSPCGATMGMRHPTQQLATLVCMHMLRDMWLATTGIACTVHVHVRMQKR